MSNPNFRAFLVIFGVLWIVPVFGGADEPEAPALGEGAPPAVVTVRPVVRGTITDANGPISGATVRIEVSSMATREVVFRTRARTDMNGVYEADLSKVKSPSMGIQVNAVDPTHEEGMRIEFAKRSGLPIDISLELRPGRSVSGHVYNDAGKAVAGAHVEVPYVRAATSEFDGFYTILGVPLVDSFSIQASAKGFSPENREIQPDSGPGTVTDVDFHLKPERIVHGRVIDEAGKPVKGAGVSIYLPLQRVWRTSDAKGKFTVNNLPYEASQAMVVASHPDFAPYEQKTEIGAGNTSLTVQLDTGGAVEGIVSSGAAGNPVAGASIALSLPDAQPNVIDRTDPTGHYAAKHLPSGEIVLTVFPPGEQSLERSGEWLAEQTGDSIQGNINPWPDQTASDLQGTAKDGTITLERRDRSGDASPDPKAPVAAEYTGTVSKDGQSMKGTFKLRGSGRSGTWEASRESGRAERITGMWLWKEKIEPPKSHLAPAHKTVEITKDKSFNENLQLPEGWSLKGVVLDGQNQPVDGARVQVFRWDDLPAVFHVVSTDAKGEFTLTGLPKGKLDILAGKQQVGFKSQQFDGPPADADKPVQLVLGMNQPMAGGGGGGKTEDMFAGSPKVGEKAPDFTATALDGTAIDLKKLEGRYVLLDFWASWCGPCVGEMPFLGKVYDKYGSRSDFTMLSVSLDFNEKDLKAALKKYNVRWPQVFDGKGWDSEVGHKYGIMAIPRIFLLDPKGKVLEDNLRGEAILKAVDKALKGDKK